MHVWLAGLQWLGDEHVEAWDQRVQMLDALRSLLTLELPFLLWRIYFEWDSLTMASGAFVYILKNLCWAVNDLMIILACGTDSPTLFHANPIKMFTQCLQGTALSSIFVGPAGIISLVATVGNKAVTGRLNARRERLALYRAWLMVEKEKVTIRQKAEAVRDFQSQLDKIDSQIAAIDAEIKFHHT